MVTTTRFIFLLILCALLTVSSVSAAPSLYYDDATSITRIGSGDLYFSSGDECVFAAVGTNVRAIWPDGGSALKLTAGETINDVCIGMDGLMYVTTTSGLYREAVGDCTNPRSLGDLVQISEHTGRISAANNGIVLASGSTVSWYSYTDLSVLYYVVCPSGSVSDVTAVPDTQFDCIVVRSSTGIHYYEHANFSFGGIWTNGAVHVLGGVYSGDNQYHDTAMLSVDTDVNLNIVSVDEDYYASWSAGWYYWDCYDIFNCNYDGSFSTGTNIDSPSYGVVLGDTAISYNYPVLYYVKSGNVYIDGVANSRLGITFTDSIGLNATLYYRGDTARIDYEVEDLSTGTYTVVVRDPTNTIKMTETVSSSNGYYEYSFADSATFGNWSANLCLNTVAVETDYATLAATGLSSVAWDKETYNLGETGSISYEIANYNSSTYDYSVDIYKAGILQTYINCTSSSGVLDYSFSDITENTIYHAKLTKYVKGSSIPLIIVTDSCTVYVVGYCQIHGGIYDSQDYHPLIGTVFIGDSYSDVVGYSDYGAYSVIVPWGTYNISAAVSSYLSYNSSNVEISGSDYNLDMFLSVNGTTTHVFRGSVTDVDSNAVIEDVLIKVYNDTFDEYDFTSQSGVWVVNGLTSGATYTLHATKDEYHSHTYSFTYDPSDFYYNFMMSLVVSEDDDAEDDVLEDALEEDESMTEYFDEKFRGFAPTIWGLFMCMCVLFFMSILTSFNSGGKRR